MLYQIENPHGGDRYGYGEVLDFSANVNPLGTPESVKRAVAEAAELIDRYPDPYCRELVSAISRYEALPSSEILCGNGAAELIYSYCAALRPKTALELAPTFSEYSLALETVGCRIDRYALEEKQDFLLTPDFLSFLQSGKWDVLFLCNPNNPSGRLIDPELLSKIVEICVDRGIRLFADECFLELTDHAPEYSLKPKLQDCPQIFILKAFTKSYGMAGLRLGYGLSSDAALLREMARLVQPWNVSLPAQRAGIAALQEAAFVEQARALIGEERNRLYSQITALGLKAVRSDANYIMFQGPVELKAALASRGILIRDCSNYHGLRAGWYRIAVRLPEENRQLVDALKKLLT